MAQYAKTAQASIFVQTTFTLSAFPGYWVLTTDDPLSQQTIAFDSCTVPSFYLSTGNSSWYTGIGSDIISINWNLCTGPQPPLPPFPWGAVVPTYSQLCGYLQANRIPGPCDGSGAMTTIYTGDGNIPNDRTVTIDTKLTFTGGPGTEFIVDNPTVKLGNIPEIQQFYLLNYNPVTKEVTWYAAQADVNIYSNDGNIAVPVRTVTIDPGNQLWFKTVSGAGGFLVGPDNTSPSPTVDGAYLWALQDYQGTGKPGALIATKDGDAFAFHQTQNLFATLTSMLGWANPTLGITCLTFHTEDEYYTELNNSATLLNCKIRLNNKITPTFEITVTELQLVNAPPTDNTQIWLLTRDNGTGMIRLRDVGTLPVPSVNTLYTADDTLTGNRTVSGGGFNLTFDLTAGASNFSLLVAGVLTISSLGGAQIKDNTLLKIGGAAAGDLQLFGGSGNIIRLYNIQNVVTTEVLYFNSGTGLLTYGAVPAGGTNIYNSDGYIPDGVNRQIVIGVLSAITFDGANLGNSFTVMGVGAINLYSPTGVMNLQCPSIFLNTIPSVDEVADDYLVRETFAGGVKIRKLPQATGFGAFLAANSTASPLPAGPTAFGAMTVGTYDYDNTTSTSLITLGTGLITLFLGQAGLYSVSISVSFQSTGASTLTPDFLTLDFHDDFAATVVYSETYAVLHGSPSNYSWKQDLYLPDNKQYHFRYSHTLATAVPNTIYAAQTRFSVQKLL